MKNNFHNDVDSEYLDIANKILEESKNINVEDKPSLSEILTDKKVNNKKTWKMRYSTAIATSVAACLIVVAGFGLWKSQSTNKTEQSTSNSKELYYAHDYNEIYKKLTSVVNVNSAMAESYTYGLDALSGGEILKSSSDRVSVTLNETDTEISYYDTNEQTDNVHEGDIVKTDGNYIYTLKYYSKKGCYGLVITKVDGIKMNVVKKIQYDNSEEMSLNMRELYVYGDKLITIGTLQSESLYGCIIDEYSDTLACDEAVTYVYVYDISNPKATSLVNTLTQDGSYISSRMKGEFLYTITDKSMYTPTLDYCVPKVNGLLMTPDTVYIPEKIETSNYTVITGLNVTKPEDFVSAESVLGGSSNVYASYENIYVLNLASNEEDITETKDGKKTLDKIANRGYKIFDNKEYQLKGFWKGQAKDYIKAYGLDIKVKDIVAYKDSGVYTNTTQTEIIKFEYDKGQINFISSDSIDGRNEETLGFDEKDGYLRCVTTEYSYTDFITRIKCYDKKGDFLFQFPTRVEYISETSDTNNVFVLDKNLKTVAEINNLAEGESIYSARYMGDYGYFVTYETTDPLFSVDFSDMKNPKIIGELKMPGYSEYLHFYGSNKLLGFGVEESSTWKKPNKLKLEMYNITNGSAKKETKTMLDNYSYSESMYNYKAIMVDVEKNLIGFDVEEEIRSDNDWTYKRYYVVYSYTGDDFKELYKIRIKNNAYDVRGFYIDNYLYVVCPDYGIYAINMDTYNNDNKVEYVSFIDKVKNNK